MQKINYKKILAFLIPLVFFIPLFIYAGSDTTIKNPLGEDNTEIKDVLIKIMSLVAKVGGVIVVFFIIYSGYLFVTAGDSDPNRSKAREVFFSTIIGAAILLGAGLIATIVVNTVKTTIGG